MAIEPTTTTTSPSSEPAPSTAAPEPAGGAPLVPADDPVDESGEEVFDGFTSLMDTLGPSGGDAPVETVTEVPAEAAPAAPAVAAPVLEPAAPVPAPAPAVAPVPAPAPQGPQAEQPQAPETPEQLLAKLQENQATIVASLAEQHFQLTPEDVEELDTNAPGVVSRMAAKVYYQSVVNTITQLQTFAKAIPAIIDAHRAATSVNEGARDRFYEQNPVLKDPKYAGAITEFATIFRQRNPRIEEKELFQRVSAAVHAQFGVAAAAAPAAVAGAPVARVVAQEVFRPAQSGAPVHIEPAAQPAPFFGLGESFDEE